MKIILTICSNNFLAQARTLIDSIIKFAPGYRVFIGLVDRESEEIDYEFFKPAKILPVADLGLPDFPQNLERYNLIELNTSVKPSLLKYLIENNENVERIFYFDPDTKLFSTLSGLESLLERHEILLTPHILRPIELDGLIPEENVFLNYGVFNLGFIGLAPGSANVSDLLDWWENRCVKKCLVRLKDGLFVDQLWINLVPYLFKNVHALKEFGFNMGPWNVHERHITDVVDGIYKLNDGSDLVFYHFSGYQFREPHKSSYDPYNRVELGDRKDLISIYSSYHQELLKNHIEKFSKLKCKLLPA